MAQVFDIMVVGLGANGSAAIYHLAATGKSVVGIDRYTPPHKHGSSHGESRIIRQAYYEDPVYVPLVKAAYPLWTELENASGKKLFLPTGGLMLGSPDAAVIKGSKLSAETHGIPYEYLDAQQISDRFPAFNPPEHTVGILEKEAGILLPEACIDAFLGQAKSQGATLRNNETVLTIRPARDKIAVRTTKGEYEVKKLILSAGAWTNQLLPAYRLPLTVKRQVLYWFKQKNATNISFLPANMPVYIWEYDRNKMFYGFPDLGRGFKIAPHHRGRDIQPDELSQAVDQNEIGEMQEMVRSYLNTDAVFDRSAVCMYTNTPDENFIIDRHPLYDNIIIASPCSGHGFKFSSLTGKILSDMALDTDPGFDLSPFSMKRFTHRK